MGARAVIYVRISEDKRRGSLDEGLGVQAQEQQCRALAERLGHRVVAVFTDNDVSAYSGRIRPGYRKMLSFLRSGKADVVLCWHTDRLHRSNVELEEYIDVAEPRDIKTETVTAGVIDLNTPMGRMVARQLCTIARYESEHRAERIALARQRQAQQGKYGGGAYRPYGFERDGVTVIPAEAEVIKRMANQVMAGISLRSIARDLRESGALTSGGTQWFPYNVRSVLLRPRNAGLMVHRDKSVPHARPYTDDDVVGTAPWDPILPEDVWRSVVAKLTDPNRRTNAATGTARKYLGSGIYRCPCGATLGVNKHGGSTQSRYRCLQPGAGHAAVPVAELDELVTQVVLERLSRPDAADLIAAPAPEVDVPALRAELATHRQRLDEIAADYDNDVITRSQMLKQTESRRAKLRQVEYRLAEAVEVSPLAPLVGVDDVAAAWEKLSLGERRAVVKAVVTVDVLALGKGRRAKIHKRVKIGPAQTRPADG